MAEVRLRRNVFIVTAVTASRQSPGYVYRVEMGRGRVAESNPAPVCSPANDAESLSSALRGRRVIVGRARGATATMVVATRHEIAGAGIEALLRASCHSVVACCSHEDDLLRCSEAHCLD